MGIRGDHAASFMGVPLRSFADVADNTAYSVDYSALERRAYLEMFQQETNRMMEAMRRDVNRSLFYPEGYDESIRTVG
jgi:hypothetical protein